MKNLFFSILVCFSVGCVEDKVPDKDYAGEVKIETVNGKIKSVVVKFPYGSNFKCESKENLKRVIGETEELLEQLKNAEEQMHLKTAEEELASEISRKELNKKNDR